MDFGERRPLCHEVTEGAPPPALPAMKFQHFKSGSLELSAILPCTGDVGVARGVIDAADGRRAALQGKGVRQGYRLDGGVSRLSEIEAALLHNASN